jgi:8-oxoguanine deaminase
MITRYLYTTDANMPTLLVKNIHTLATMDANRREIYDAALWIRDNAIEQVGITAELPDTADEILDLQGKYLVLPGLINTHHHFYQTLTRVIPAAQNCDLFNWLQTLYPIWAKLTPESIAISAQIAAAELILSGCTTASDHLYLYPNGTRLEDEIEAVRETGLRFHASRGSMSVGESAGGLPPDALVESEEKILHDSRRLIESYHDNRRYSMLKITLAPCSPFSVSRDLMRESARLARSYPGVRLHTHLAENQSDIDYSLEVFGMSPVEYAESVEWLGEDVWHAHCVRLDDRALARFAETGTGVAHCPSSNLRLASGLAPIRKMLDRGIPVSMGVDGSASNDSSNLFYEVRMAFLMARVRSENAAAMTAREALEIATLGGARVLGRDDIGALAPGMAADFIAINLDRPELAGALHDPIAAVIFCGVNSVDYSFINGQKIVDRGRFTGIDREILREKHNRIARQLLEKSPAF